jgi:hypothetical protein
MFIGTVMGSLSEFGRPGHKFCLERQYAAGCDDGQPDKLESLGGWFSEK